MQPLIYKSQTQKLWKSSLINLVPRPYLNCCEGFQIRDLHVPNGAVGAQEMLRTKSENSEQSVRG